MKIISILLAALMLLTTTVSAANDKTEIPATDDRILYTGRWVANEKGKVSGTFEGEIRIVFTGTSLGAKGSGSAYVSVDGGEPTKIELSNRSFVKDLAEGTHTAIISTAAQLAFPTISAFYIDNGATLQKAEKTKQIEFIGDSILEGYVRSGENASIYTYGYLVARALGWDRNTVAFGGITLTENHGNPDKTGMVNRYFKNKEYVAEKDDATEWDTTQFVPDVIVINLGTNDKGQANDTEFMLAYTRFLTQLRSCYPDTDIFVMNPFQNRMEDAITRLKAINKVEKVIFVDSAAWDVETAEDNLHLDQNGHKQAAELLQKEIEAYYNGDKDDSAGGSSDGASASGQSEAPAEASSASSSCSSLALPLCIAGAAVIAVAATVFVIVKKRKRS